MGYADKHRHRVLCAAHACTQDATGLFVVAGHLGWFCDKHGLNQDGSNDAA
jgi:hypothetical protein